MAKRKRSRRTNKNVPSTARLRVMADRLWSHAVRDKWANKCAVCGKRRVEAHHLVPRQHYRTRYQLNNGIALCAHHHKFDPHLSPHLHAAAWMLWLRKHHPTRAQWCEEVSTQFVGTRNADYFCDVIRGLREYVPAEEFERIVGVRFAAWLEGTQTNAE